MFTPLLELASVFFTVMYEDLHGSACDFFYKGLFLTLFSVVKPKALAEFPWNTVSRLHACIRPTCLQC